MWLVPHANKPQETSAITSSSTVTSISAARNWRRQQATADLVLFHPPYPVKVDKFNVYMYVLVFVKQCGLI